MYYTVDETVIAISDNTKGEVVGVGNGVFYVTWLGDINAVTYPIETERVRKLWPWEVTQ